MIEFKPSYKTTLTNNEKSTHKKKDGSFTPSFILPNNNGVIDIRSRVSGSRFKSRLIVERIKKDDE
jgi:hypothetical protein